MDAIEARLRRERATASSLELDELKLRAMRQAAQKRGVRGNFMKSRLALLTMIVAGLMMSTTGATLAVTGSSGSGSAANNEYYYAPPPGEDRGVSGGETLAGQEEGVREGPAAPGAGAGGGEQPAAAQEAAQAEAAVGEKSRPFTGFLAIPLLIGGVALLGTGAVLRWKAGD
jgi:hypothetical protein